MGRRARACALALVLIAATGCVSGAATQAGIPSAAAPSRVQMLGVRGPYLDAVVHFGEERYRFFFPDDDFCRALLQRSEEVEYTASGPYGRVRVGEVSCDPIGLLSLEEWRDKGPRPRLSGPNPRRRADFKVFYVDEDLFLARGRFPLAGMIGWAGSYDTVAVVANVPECEEIMTEGAATMEFHHSGDEPIVLLDDRLRCPILGFAQPVQTFGR